MFWQNAPPNAPLPPRIVSLHSKPPTTTPPILSAIRKFSANYINAAAPAVTSGHLGRLYWLLAPSRLLPPLSHELGGRGFPKEGNSYLLWLPVVPSLCEYRPIPPPPAVVSRISASSPTAASWGLLSTVFASIW